MKTLRPIHANRGKATAYKRQLTALIEEMSDSYLYWLTAAYKANPPVAADTLPSNDARDKLDNLGKQWIKRFDDMAETIATSYVTGMAKLTNKAMLQALKDAGWAVEFKMTRAMRDAMEASITENVSLIKSIQSQYHTKIEGIVMRNYAKGGDLYSMRTEIQQVKPITVKRAVLIARDQSNKLNAVVQKARQQELGITQAKWMHSGAGKEPRPDHVAADGKIYDIDKGCLISGEYIYPGELINCRCVCRSVLPF